MEGPDAGELSPLRRFNLIFRFSYTLPFVLASVCGIVCAVPYGPPWHVMVLVPAAVLMMALFVNFSNDYFDHMSGIDAKVHDQRFRTQRNLMTSEALRKLYWEGNQFDTGLVSERQGRVILVCIAAATALLAVPVVLYAGWPVVVLGAIGILLAWFYTAPPVNLGARGLGEAAVGVSFFMMALCSFYVASGTVTPEMALFSVMVGLVVGLMRLVDSMSADDAHREMGEMNLSIRLGKDGTAAAIRLIAAAAYVVAAALVLFDWVNALLFLTLPLTLRMLSMVRGREEHWDVAIIPYSFGFAVLTEMLFIAASAVTLAFGHCGLL